MPVAAIANGWPVVVCPTENGIHAVLNRCPHAGSPLDAGRVRRGAITCPLHGARFDLATGRCVGGPYPPLRVFPVSVTPEGVAVTVPADPPPPDHLPLMPV